MFSHHIGLETHLWAEIIILKLFLFLLLPPLFLLDLLHPGLEDDDGGWRDASDTDHLLLPLLPRLDVLHVYFPNGIFDDVVTIENAFKLQVQTVLNLQEIETLQIFVHDMIVRVSLF